MLEPGSTIVVAPGWYAENIGRGVVSHEDVLKELTRAVRAVARRSPLVRGAALAWATRRGRLAVIKGVPGTTSALFFSAALSRQRNVVVLEFIRRGSSTRLRGAAYEFWRRLIEVPAVRRGMLIGVTLTDWEGGEYSRLYGVERERFEEVRWPLCRWGDQPRAQVGAESRAVMSSGRAHCDWETLFAAAHQREWTLTVACSTLDERRARRVNTVGAELVVEVSRAHHDNLLARSAVYVMALKEEGVSAGHVRLMAAVENGVPVVASAVRALSGYVIDGQTAVLVPPGDPAALGEAVDALLADPARRRELRDNALNRAREWTYSDYFDRMHELIKGPT